MLRLLCAALCCAGLALPAMAADRVDEESAGPVFELRLYTCEPGKLPALLERFQDHTLRMFEKHGMKNLAYWTPTDGPEATNTLIYLLEHASREAAVASWAEFRADPEWLAVAANSELTHGKILSCPPESVYLKRTDYSPEVGLPPAGRVFDLRRYAAAHGKFDALNARFRDHTDALFKKHGMQAYGYWTPIDPPASNNSLIYVLEFPSREAAEESWAAFRADPEWKKVLAETEKDGSLTAVRPVSLYMNLADISPVAEDSVTESPKMLPEEPSAAK